MGKCFLRLITLLTGLLAAPLFAQCPDTGTVLVYGNGVNRTYDKADKDRIRLRDAARPVLAPRVIADSWLAYNRTDNLLLDLIESAAQDRLTDFVQVSRWLAGLEPMPDAVKERLLEIAKQFDKAAISNIDLQKHVDQYHEFLKTNRTVLVAHSQGNFFANLAWDSLSGQEQRSFRIVSVANPDSFVAGYSPPYVDAYVTSSTDFIIQGLRLAGRPALAPNITNPLTLRDLTGHGFIDTYMRSGAPSRDVILGDVVQAAVGLEQPPCSPGPGNQFPVAAFTVNPASAVVGEVVQFDGSTSTDADGLIQTYRWTFGDGESAEGITTSHAYAAPGTYSVSLTVTDNDGASAAAAMTVIVASGPFDSVVYDERVNGDLPTYTDYGGVFAPLVTLHLGINEIRGFNAFSADLHDFNYDSCRFRVLPGTRVRQITVDYSFTTTPVGVLFDMGQDLYSGDGFFTGGIYLGGGGYTTSTPSPQPLFFGGEARAFPLGEGTYALQGGPIGTGPGFVHADWTYRILIEVELAQ